MKITWFIPPTIINNFIPSWFYKHKIFKCWFYDRVTASIWIRCLQLIPYFEKKGVKCRINQPDAEADIAVFIRWQDNQAYDALQRQKDRGRKIVFDMCVNYFDESSHLTNGYGVTTTQVGEVLRMVKIADVITCGSEFIRERASKFHCNAVYLPESIDKNHFRFEKLCSDFTKPVLKTIWAGQPAKISELADIYPALTARGIPLTIISSKKPVMPGPYTFIPWSYNTFPKTILNGEICISPRRTDNPYDLGHSHCKIGVFMAQGVPSIASPLPSYKEVINNSGGGRICDSRLDWEKSLDEVIEDRHILCEWSQAAIYGMKKYSTESVVNKYLQLFESLCGTKG